MANSFSSHSSDPVGFWNRQPAWLTLLVSILGVGLVGMADHWTGPDLSFALFYLLPIAFSAWFQGRRQGLLVAVISAVTWHWVYALTALGHPHPSVPVWNALTRLCFFVIVTLLLDRLRDTVTRERHLSRTDYLTSVLNSRAFYEFAEWELARSRRRPMHFSLAYIDLDNFKSVNDRYGHNVGDNLLKVVARTMRESLRASDVVARLGGDEFAVLLPETDDEAARIAVEKLRQRLLAAMRGAGWPVTFSIGVVTCESAPDSLQQLVKMADDLMYTVKASTKNAVSHETYRQPEPIVMSS